MVHLGMIIRLTSTVEQPEAVTDSTGEVVGIDFDPDEPSDATEHTSPVEGIRILHKLPTVTVKLHNVTTEFLLQYLALFMLPTGLAENVGAAISAQAV